MTSRQSLRNPTGGVYAVVDASVTRPADTVAYSAGDVVSTTTGVPVAMTFANIGGEMSRGGKLYSATLINSVAAATKPDIDLYLFDVSPVIAADNAAWTPTDAEMLNCLGVVAFTGANFKVGNGNGIIHNLVNPGLPFVCAVRDLYGVMVARSGYTPTATEVFTIRLGVQQD